MDCPHCKKKTSDRSAKCEHCGRGVRTAKTRDPLRPVHCPRCVISADIITVGDLELDLCPKCGGIWFDKGEIAALEKTITDIEISKDLKAALTSVAAVRPSAPPRLYLPCPVCNQPMLQKNYAEVSGLLVERCPEHGTWVTQDQAVKLIEVLSEVGTDALLKEAASFRTEQLERTVRTGELRQSLHEARLHNVQSVAWIHLILDLLGFM